jgi:UDP-N-acetylmuramate--alanine ligase
MKAFNQIKCIYFLGIGGIGMSAIARYFNHFGKQVYGYDKTETELTKELVSEGIYIKYEEDLNRLKHILSNYKEEEILLVYTPAIPKDHTEYVYIKDQQLAIYKRSEVLGQISKAFRTIAVAGTHGKTTTSSMIAHILKASGINTFAFLGGITQNYQTNLLLGDPNDMENAWLVVEADEYDRSFLTLSPTIAIINSVDADHLDIYGNETYMLDSYKLFAGLVKPEGHLIVKKAVDNTIGRVHLKQVSYSLNSEADIKAFDLEIAEGYFHYSVSDSGNIVSKLQLGMPGLHNVENSLAAIAVAKLVGIENEALKLALRSFKGVKRRFEYQIKRSDLVFIDDYAHHPEELNACIRSVKQLYPNRKVTGIFQPHLYSRTRDFLDGFASSLDLLDECILLEIYPARELPIEGINSNLILSRMNIHDKELMSKSELLEEIESMSLEVLLTLGAGDIDQLVPLIKNKLV